MGILWKYGGETWGDAEGVDSESKAGPGLSRVAVWCAGEWQE